MRLLESLNLRVSSGLSQAVLKQKSSRSIVSQVDRFKRPRDLLIWIDKWIDRRLIEKSLSSGSREKIKNSCDSLLKRAKYHFILEDE